MNKLLFGLGASLFLMTFARAQEAPSSALRMPKLPSTPIQLEPVEGKPGIFTLKSGKYDFRELLTELAAKTGGKAIFDNEFKLTTLSLFQPFQGTVPEIIERLGMFGVTVGRVGTDWVFVQVKTEKKALPMTFNPFSRPLSPPKMDPFGFNINPTPGQNLPPDATPFEFNGDRVYHVPIRPNHK